MFVSRIHKWYVGILAKGYELFLPAKPTGPTPQLAACGRDPQMQSTSIYFAIWFFTRLSLFDFVSVMHHNSLPRNTVSAA
jgi:hypothetical protein